MSSGVPDQMKVPGNTAKTVEERNIPWSQQVDEASYENLASPLNDDNAVTNSNSMQFQYPPFNVKENQNASWSTYKSRKTPNFESKKYGKAAFHNSAKRDDFQSSTWVGSNTRKPMSNTAPNRTNKFDENFATGKLDNRAALHESTEEKKAGPAVTKKTTWASIASQPAKLSSRTTSTTSSHKKKGPGMPPPPMVPGKHNLDVNTWDVPNSNPHIVPPVPSPPSSVDIGYSEVNSDLSLNINIEQDKTSRSVEEKQETEITKDESKMVYNNSNYGRTRYSPNGHARKNWPNQNSLQQNRPTASGPLSRENNSVNTSRYSERRNYHVSSRSDQDSEYELHTEQVARNVEPRSSTEDAALESPLAVLDELWDKNNYNPAEIDLEKAMLARFFVIKSYSEDDIHRSIKYEIWCSTGRGNKRLDDAFKERNKEGGHILLFFSVNGSGHFCGMAQMMTAVDYNSTSKVWSQDKWKGKFKVKWIYVKDVPNPNFRHIRLENNDNKAVTNSRDTQEVPNAKGIEVLQILHSYKHSTSIFDDFYHYEKKQVEEVSSKKPVVHENVTLSQSYAPTPRYYNRPNDERGNAPQKPYVPGAAGTSFRDRSNTHRNVYHSNFNDHRRFESNRTINNADHQQREKDGDAERENGEYGARHVQKCEYIRRDDRSQQKHNNWHFSEDHKSEPRFRTGPRDIQKDNEHSIVDRTRGIDF